MPANNGLCIWLLLLGVQMDNDKIERVILALRKGDISDCLVSDIKHAEEVLTKIGFLNHLAPGFADEMFDTYIPHFIALHNRAAIGEEAQKRADAGGFGSEWAAAIEAGQSSNQKDYLARMVSLYMKVNDVNQATAIRAAAEQLGRDEDSIRRQVTRSKSRKKAK